MAEKKATEQTCIICLELFTEPKVLPCCHTFCKRCLEVILDKAKKKEKLACPQCRVEHQVPSNGPKGFLTDYTLPIKLTKSKATSTIPKCESCDQQGKAVSYCNDCPAYLCDSCTGGHKTIKFLKGHNIEPLSASKALVPAKKTIHCSEHPDKPLELYCKTCQCVACLLCFVSSHNGHNLGNIDSETRKGIEGQIEELATKAESKLKEYEDSLKYITDVEKETAKEPEKLKTEINTSFDSLIKTIEARRAALLEEVEANTNKDLKELWAQKELVEMTITGLRGTLSFANRSLQCTSDLEILLLGTQVMSRLKELGKKNWESTSIETIDMTTRKYSFKSLAGLTTLGDIETSLPIKGLEITPPISAQLGQPVTIHVQTATRHPKLQVKVLHRKARAEIPHPPTVTPNPNKRGWTVVFTPIVRGPHIIKVAQGCRESKNVESTIIVSVDGYDRDGYDRDGYDRDGNDRDGYDRDGYDVAGYDRDGNDRDGYDAAGYDRAGYDAAGYDRAGYDRDGYDRYGSDRDGYDRDGYGTDSYNTDSYNSDGYDGNI